MKFLNTTLLLFLIILFHPSLSHSIQNHISDNGISDLAKGYYLVVGAFKVPKNAVRYSSFINSRGENSKVGKNPVKEIYYVYVFESQDLELIKSKWTEYRLQDETFDAWVFKNGMPAEEVQKELADSESPTIFQDPEEKVEKQAPKVDIPSIESNTGEGEGYSYLFNTINSTTLKEVPGFITVVDEARNKVIASVDSNTPVNISDPGTQTKKVIFICDIFGYTKQQISLKVDEPLSSGEPGVAISDDGTTVVNFELARHKAGDILTMYQVYFYNDAAIMKPESKFELNSLLDMLKENENLKIKIHGHTNGNAPGKIIKLKEDDNNFFDVTSNNIDGFGSAKELSAERSNVIKRWLMEQGISEKRMEQKGWGGKKMVYDKKSEQAIKNIRVEIEILKD